ncbi:MAG: sensor histidine kinase [Halobacteriaceae archaeon]
MERGSTSSRTGSDDAVEHGGEGITVTVGALDDGFYVEDTGQGIPEGDRDRAFEFGYSTDSDGTGFGLAIVENVVESHGWTVDVAEGEAGGARFEITGVERVD